MTGEEVVEIFRKAGGVKEGHFVLTSGKHSGQYWEKFQVLQYPEYTEQLCRAIADHFRPQNVEVVAGPTTGGVILAYEVARQLGTRGIFAERCEDEAGRSGRAFRRGFSIRPGERVLVVDDILTTGGSVKDVVEEVKRLGANLLGVAVLIDRSGGKVDFGVPLFSLYQLSIPTWEPADCPLCQAGQPLTKPGSS
jgi:orotate phosphoribosyltransferase